MSRSVVTGGMCGTCRVRVRVSFCGDWWDVRDMQSPAPCPVLWCGWDVRDIEMGELVPDRVVTICLSGLKAFDFLFRARYYNTVQNKTTLVSLTEHHTFARSIPVSVHSVQLLYVPDFTWSLLHSQTTPDTPSDDSRHSVRRLPTLSDNS